MKGINFLNGKIGYLPIPKIACTSIKNSIFTLNNDRSFNSEIDQGGHIHQYFEKNYQDITNCENRILIVRDPIKRFLSAYGNRVTHHRELSFEKIKDSNPLIAGKFEIYNPGLGVFIDNFHEYSRVSSIGHHTKPISKWIKGDASFFNKIIPLENINDFSDIISREIKKEFVFPREQTGGTKHYLTNLNKDQIEFLMNYYKEDYMIFKKFYSFDGVWKEWKNGI